MKPPLTQGFRWYHGHLVDMATDRPLGSTELASLLADLTPDHVTVELIDTYDHLADFIGLR